MHGYFCYFNCFNWAVSTGKCQVSVSAGHFQLLQLALSFHTLLAIVVFLVEVVPYIDGIQVVNEVCFSAADVSISL